MDFEGDFLRFERRFGGFSKFDLDFFEAFELEMRGDFFIIDEDFTVFDGFFQGFATFLGKFLGEKFIEAYRFFNCYGYLHVE